MYDFLKKLFEEGALTFDQFVEKLNADKDIKLANLADGGYVSKDKFDSKVTELTGVKDQLEAANAEIQSYKDMDIEGIKKSAADWETKYAADTEALKQQLETQATEFAAQTYLGGFKYTNDLVREAIYAKFMAKNFQRGEDGKFEGADDFMKEMQTAYPTGFVTEPTNPPTGGEGGNTGAGNEGGNPPKKTPWFAPQTPPAGKQKKRTLSEMMAYKNEHPDATINFD